MKVMLADDEPLARDRLRRLLSEIDDCELIAELHNGRELIEQVEHHQPDVVLVDIHMPEMDGLKTARALARMPLPPAVIFTTAHSEHALSAFDAAASAYLLKPIRREELVAALLRAQQPRRAQLAAITDTSTGSRDRYLVLRIGRKQQRIAADQVICCLADQKLTRVLHRQGEGWCDESLQELETRLGDDFLRVHRSTLVAVRYIQGLSGSGNEAKLQLLHTEQSVPVSRRRLPALRALLRR